MVIIKVSQAAGDELSRRDSFPRTAPLLEVWSLACQEGQKLALHAATPLDEAMPTLVLLFVSSRLERGGEQQSTAAAGLQ